jgi:hypothetical protein
MAISKKTATEIKRVFEKWCEVKGISFSRLWELFDQLSKVPGNKSYTESVLMLRGLVDDIEEDTLDKEKEIRGASKDYHGLD